MVSPPHEALRRCVGDPDAFLAEHWTRHPHLNAGADATGFTDLLSVADVDQLVTSSGLRTPALRLVRDGTPVPTGRYTRTARLGSRSVSDLVHPGRVLDLMSGGATVVLQGLQRYWPPLARLCRDLETTMSHAVQANAYLTPPGAQGLRIHHDTHDVLALQTHGRKHWVVYEPHLEAPLPGQGWAGDEARTPPVLDVQLRPGDCLYVPRGTPHAAATVAESSLHITIGIVTTTWHDLLRRLVERARDEPAFRRSLPPGYARPAGGAGASDEPTVAATAQMLQDVAKWVTEQDPAALLDEAAERFWSTRQPLLSGQLGQVLALESVDDDTRLSRRPGTAAQLRRDGDDLELVLGDRRVRLPARLHAAVRRLLDADGLRVGDLADLLDAPGRLVLARRLIKEGLVVADHTGHEGSPTASTR